MMSKPKRPSRRTLEVTIMFEPSRLASEHLADAYARLVPLRRHGTSPRVSPGGSDLNAEVVARRQRS
jgi:hypothetical protein